MKEYIQSAIEQAQIAGSNNEVPVGAVVVSNGKIIGQGHNKRLTNNLVTAHAEVNAIIEASQNINDWRLTGCDLYTTLEPCKMCQEIIKQSRIKNVYFLLSRNLEKKEYNTNFEQLFENTEMVEKYHQSLMDFFKHKR